MVQEGLSPLEPPPWMATPPPPLALVSGVLPEADTDQKAGSVGVIFTLWNTMMGSALLVMPYTFSQTGWLLALLLSVFCAWIAQFTCGLILDYSQGMMADPSAEFADLAHLHFGAIGRLVAFITGNVVVVLAATGLHGYQATVAMHLIALPPVHGGLCMAPGLEANSTDTQHLSPCLAPFVRPIRPVSPYAPPPILVIAALLITLPLANVPSIRLLARLNTVGIVCFMTVLAFGMTSAAVNGVKREAFDADELAHPEAIGVAFGMFSLSFFIHNAVMTIMRGAAEPSNNKRDLASAFGLSWLCYVAMGLTANLCPPLHDLRALSSKKSANGMLSLDQPPEMAPFLVIARMAVLLQSLSVYPVLLFIVRSQLFTAVFKRPYPGPLPTLALSVVLASITTTLTAGGVSISTVLGIAGAGGGLVCCFALPALIHGRVNYLRGTLTPKRLFVVVFLLVYGFGVVAAHFYSMAIASKSSGNATDLSNASDDARNGTMVMMAT